MELEIKWSPKALDNYVIILKRIQQNFGDTPAKNFQSRFQGILNLLTKFPELGTLQDKTSGLRGIILYRRTSIFYKTTNTSLQIINVVDNRWRNKNL